MQDTEELIDIVYLQCATGDALKTFNQLGEEILKKVAQHLAAKKTAGICISASGSKFDTRGLTKNKVSIDSAGYLTVNGQRITVFLGEKYIELLAERLRGYTILRFIEEEGAIRIFDEYDLMRADKKGMYIDLKGPSPVIKRDELTDKMKEHLREILGRIPRP